MTQNCPGVNLRYGWIWAASVLLHLLALLLLPGAGNRPSFAPAALQISLDFKSPPRQKQSLPPAAHTAPVVETEKTAPSLSQPAPPAVRASALQAAQQVQQALAETGNRGVRGDFDFPEARAPEKVTVSEDDDTLDEYIKPQVLYSPAPDIPPSLRRNNVKEPVMLRIALDSNGKPTQVIIVRSSGAAEFDQLARKTVLSSWRFKAAQRGGVAVEDKIDMPVRLNLVD
ncbi:energy transducer TonB [Chitinibacter sp. S2-10]|uniref:energy transducer TonB n=1 Tax=Chitinibacter sp. S2-10 TaxID=3373597 RepID=UPI0039777D72